MIITDKMDLRFVLLVSALILSTFLVEARRRTGGRRRPGRVTGLRYSWTRALGNGTTVSEEAFVQETGDRSKVFVKSVDDQLTAAGFTKAALLYDFTSTPAILSITVQERHSRRPCYVLDTTLTIEEVINILTEINNTVTSRASQVSLDGSGPVLSRSDSSASFASNPSVRLSCRRIGIVRVSTNTAGSSENTEVLKVLALDSVVNLRAAEISRPSRRPGRRPRPGSNRGNTRGG